MQCKNYMTAFFSECSLNMRLIDYSNYFLQKIVHRVGFYMKKDRQTLFDMSLN